MKKILLFSLFIALLFGLGLNACKKHPAQFPSNKIVDKDSTEQSLIEMNKAMTLREDSLIQEFINKQSVVFRKIPSGIWYRIQKTTKLDSIKNDSIISFSYIVYSLEGVKLKEGIKTNQFNKKELPAGLEEGLKLMRKGESARIIIPWYLAYGMQGNEEIPPYTSIIYDVSCDK